MISAGNASVAKDQVLGALVLSTCVLQNPVRNIRSDTLCGRETLSVALGLSADASHMRGMRPSSSTISENCQQGSAGKNRSKLTMFALKD